MRLRLLLAAAGTLALAACSDSPSAPTQLDPAARSNDEITCRSGYHIATFSDGTTGCVKDESEMRVAQ